MKYRASILVVLTLVASVGLRGRAAIQVPLTIQEAVYPGSISGVTRTNDPVTVGIPLPDDAATGATDISELGLTGANAGQFRVLGRWPSGRIKWVQVDTQASLSAGTTAAGIAVTSGGGGNFGGSNLAADNGATITVSTGSATFTIRKANFNGFDQVVVGGTTVVASGTSQGLVVTGPAPGQTTCGVCTTVYSSANDASSTAVIEENGPVRAVVRATGSHKDGSGNAYMKFTVRMHFYKNKSQVKAVSTLRNADNGASNSFATAYKGLAGYEWRTRGAVGGTQTYDIAKHDGTVENGTLSGSEDIHIYQGRSKHMEQPEWDSVVPQYTSDTGYTVRKNGVPVATGTNTQYPGGWADVRNSAGAGISIGVYQMAAYWPKSLEFAAGGSDVRIGIWPRQNSRTYYQAWPQWSTHDLYFNFHSSALPSPANEFLKFQHYLVARAPYTHYNATAVFPWPLVDNTMEQAFYVQTGAAGVPALGASSAWPYPDHGTTNSTLFVHRAKNWGQGGGENQMELRWSYLMNYLSRGMTGRYLQAAHFYRFQTDDVFPHSDGFTWRDQTSAIEPGYGRPNVASLNSSEAFRAWIDSQHQHWSGMLDFYFLTGDELVKEAILDGPLDLYTTPNTYGTTRALLGASREVGARLLGYARFSTFLNAIGQNSEATTVINYGTHIYEQQVKPDTVCPASNQTATGCTAWNPASDGVFDGTDRLRGLHWAGGGYGSWCGVSGGSSGYRGTGPLQHGILVSGLLEFMAAKGTGWADYWEARDLAYGIARSTIAETYFDNGSGRWDQQGFFSAVLLDRVSGCTPPATEDDHLVEARTTIWALFSALYVTEGTLDPYRNQLTIGVQKVMGALNTNWGENGSYAMTHLIYALNTPRPRLQDVAITSFTNNGGGSYTIGWTVPSGAQSYRVKWGDKRIVDWIGFRAETYTWLGDPVNTMNWFAAANVPSPPAPTGAGSTQTLTISTGKSGLTAANFSVKAYATGSVTTPPPPAAPVLSLYSGNSQSGTAGTLLSTPLTVRVTDTSGSPMAGASVTFAVTAGGGTLTSPQAPTNSSGLASTTLRLGAAAGTNTVSASIAPSVVTFTAVASEADAESGITVNNWINVTPTYQGAPNGGQLTPMTFNNMGVYDPVSKRTITFERWYDTVRSMSIYANSLIAYDPGTNTASVLKVSNWTEGYLQLPANATEPTPIDRHPLGGLGLDPVSNSVYLVNGANQNGRAYYPDHPNDTWKFSLQNRSWTKVSDSSGVHPPTDVATYSGMVHDPSSGKLVYFVVDGSNGTRTWLHDPQIGQWTAVNPDPSASQVFISIAGIAYDSRRQLILAYGGGPGSTAEPSAQLWAYSVSQNKWTALANAPIGASAPEFAYDSVHDVFLALVGQQTLIYNPRTNAWTQLAATIDRGANLNRQNVTYNPGHDVFVFQGGTWDQPVWSLFRYTDAASPAALAPAAPTSVRIIR